MVEVILKNNKTGEEVKDSYTARDLLSHCGEDGLIENMIENHICNCHAVGETYVTDCNCYEEWEDCTLMLME